MVGGGAALLPLDEHDLGDDEDDKEDEDHLRVHLGVARVLLVHLQVLVVPFLLGRQLVPLNTGEDGSVGGVGVNIGQIIFGQNIGNI